MSPVIALALLQSTTVIFKLAIKCVSVLVGDLRHDYRCIRDHFQPLCKVEPALTWPQAVTASLGRQFPVTIRERDVWDITQMKFPEQLRRACGYLFRCNAAIIQMHDIQSNPGI